jgi:hypothetical protein
VHGTDARLSGALGRVLREDSPLAVGGIICAWPAESDGRFRIALSDVAGNIVWRAFAIAEIATGRGRLSAVDEYAARFASGVSPCVDANRDSWTRATEWILRDGIPDACKRWPDPHKRRAHCHQLAKAHERYAAAGLAMPDQDLWRPRATLLFLTPKPVETQQTLAPADEEALTWLAP